MKVKTRLQAGGSKYSGPFDCFRKIISTEGGVRALYRGLGPNLTGVIPEKGIKLVRFYYANYLWYGMPCNAMPWKIVNNINLIVV